MQNILNLNKTNKLILAAVTFLAVMALGSGRAHAATLMVGSGCTIADAIDSVNAGSDQASCGGTSYGSSDTINIPAGTFTLDADLPEITEAVVINGVGLNQTIIDGDQQYRGFSAHDIDQITITNLKIAKYERFAIKTQRTNVTLRNIDVDGSDANNDGGELYGIDLHNNDSETRSIDTENIYIHDLNTTGNAYMHVFVVEQSGNGTTNANLRNTTLANIHSGGGLNGFIISSGLWDASNSGTINATITNTTVSNLTADALAAPFASVAFSDGGNSSLHTVVQNVTITGTRGAGSFATASTAAFYAVGSASGSGDTTNVTVDVSNSLMADNLNETTSQNCSTANVSSYFSGVGTVNTTINSLGHNISDDDSCASFTQNGDKQNVSNIISTLGPLQNNGGLVATRALLEGSPAISSGSAVLGVSTDARGVARPADCPSVGAYQFVGAVCGATTTSPSPNAVAPNSGAKTASMFATLLASILGVTLLGFSLKKRA